MTYYNPFLAAWFQGATGRELARLSTQLTLQLNQILREVYSSSGAPVAPVEERFSTSDFSTTVELPGVGSSAAQRGPHLPVDVDVYPRGHPRQRGRVRCDRRRL